MAAKMKVVYIIGPFRGKSNWDVQQNVRRAEAMALEVARLGAMPLCPHKNTENFDGLLTGEFWLEGTKELLRRCDAAIVLPGWPASAGSVGEIEEAAVRGIFIANNLDELRGWLEAKRREDAGRELKELLVSEGAGVKP
jgi:hypothetical protein